MARRLTDSKKDKGGRPEVWTEEYRAEVVKLIESYTTKTKYPSVADFCFTHRIRKQRLYEFDDLKEPLDWLLAKKEKVLEEMGRKITKEQGGRATFIIFALKQLGWRDKTEVEHSGEIKSAPVVNVICQGVQNGPPTST